MRVQPLASRIATEFNRLKTQWLDECMQRLVPPEINIAAHSDKGRYRMKVSRWLVQHKIRLSQHPDKTCIIVDGNPVAEFAATIKDNKFVVTTRTLPPDKKDN